MNFINTIYLNINRNNNLKPIIEEIEAINFHRVIANRQRAAYNEQKINLKNDSIVIELDWKQKVLIGNSFL